MLPLLVGLDLSRKKISEIKAHLGTWSECQEEYQSYVLSLDKTMEWLAQERMDWRDQEWQSAIRGAIEEQPARFSPLMPWPFKKSWAYAVMAVLIVVLTLFVVRPYRYDFDDRRETMTISREIPSVASMDKAQQKVVSMTLVSRETGLKIAWFFNKDFDFEEEK